MTSVVRTIHPTDFLRLSSLHCEHPQHSMRPSPDSSAAVGDRALTGAGVDGLALPEHRCVVVVGSFDQRRSKSPSGCQPRHQVPQVRPKQQGDGHGRQQCQLCGGGSHTAGKSLTIGLSSRSSRLRGQVHARGAGCASVGVICGLTVHLYTEGIQFEAIECSYDPFNADESLRNHRPAMHV